MKLYFNGDSFVSGCELGDDLLKDYPGLLTWPMDTRTHDLHREWLLKSHAATPIGKIHERGAIIDQITKLELERAFPNKVSMLTNIPVINRAIHGASMDYIVRTTITDLYNLKKENPNEEIIAFIGTTYPHRWEVAYDKENLFNMHGVPQDWICLSSSYTIDAESDYLKTTRKNKTIYYTPYHALVNYYKNIVLAQDFCKLNGITLYWIATYDNILKRPLDMGKYEDRADINMLMEYANFKYTLDMREILETEFVRQNAVCPGGHFGEPIHERTAQEIVKIING